MIDKYGLVFFVFFHFWFLRNPLRTGVAAPSHGAIRRHYPICFPSAFHIYGWARPWIVVSGTDVAGKRGANSGRAPAPVRVACTIDWVFRIPRALRVQVGPSSTAIARTFKRFFG